MTQNRGDVASRNSSVAPTPDAGSDAQAPWSIRATTADLGALYLVTGSLAVTAIVAVVTVVVLVVSAAATRERR